MEQLLDQADALVRTAAAAGGAAPPRPNFAIPDEYAHTVPIRSDILVLKEDSHGGQGWCAASDLPAGTLLLTAKPLAMMMDWQDDDEGDDDHENADGHVSGNAVEHGDDDEEEEEGDDDDDEAADGEDGMMHDAVKDTEKEPRLNELLLLEILHKLQDDPSLWRDKLATLFPRNDADLAKLPAWVCHNDDVFMQVETLLAALEKKQNANPIAVDLPIKEISKRLPLILRYNILSMETCAELLSYPGPDGHSELAGVALYHAPSFFNHSARPNVSRWCVGDVMGFTTNQDVSAGTELCISYIEHDVLCEPAWRRNRMLAMDFTDEDAPPTVGAALQGDDADNQGAATTEAGGPDMPVVDSDVQNELMSMDPFARLQSIDELLAQAAGSKLPTDSADGHALIDSTGHDSSSMSTSGSPMMEGAATVDNAEDNGDANGGGGIPWFQCDVHNLRILKAITLDGLGQTSEALSLWEESIQFVEQHLPPLDESSIVLRVQAALCAFQLGGGVVATAASQRHADVACRTHSVLFGGGTALFRRRLGRDINLALRPAGVAADADVSSVSAADELWPL